MATENLQVSASADDCRETDDTTIILDGLYIIVGKLTSVRDGGFRWQSVDIPQASTITSATLSMFVNSDLGALVAIIKGIDEDDTATWSSGSRPSQRTKTTATINANEANWGNWGDELWATIDITSIIQEIIDRGGWAANNALAIVIENNTDVANNYVYFRAYDYEGNAHGAKLDIVYESRTAKLSRSTMNVHPGVMFQTLTGGHGY